MDRGSGGALAAWLFGLLFLVGPSSAAGKKDGQPLNVILEHDIATNDKGSGKPAAKGGVGASSVEGEGPDSTESGFGGHGAASGPQYNRLNDVNGTNAKDSDGRPVISEGLSSGINSAETNNARLLGRVSGASYRAAVSNEKRAVTATGPDQVRLFLQAGNEFSGAGRPQESERVFRSVLALDPKSIAGQQGLAQSLYQQGRTEEAAVVARNLEQNYRQTLVSSPMDVASQQGLAQSLYQQGRTEEAAVVAKQLLKQDPDNKVAKMLSGTSPDVQRASGITDKVKRITEGFLRGQAEEDLPGGAAMPGQAPSGRAAQAAALLGGTQTGPGAILAGAPASQGRLTPQQVADFANAARGGRVPIVYTPLVQKGLTRRELGDYTGALLVLSQAVDEDPKDAVAWTVRAEVDNALRNFPAAISDAGTALDLKPPEPVSARALRARAYAHLESGESQRALADVSRSIELDPRSGLGFLYRAMAEERLGMTEAAARDLETAVGLDPSLAPLAAPLRDKLGLSTVPRQKAPRLDKRLVRGGAIALSLLLVLLGLLGTQRGRELTRRWATPVRAAQDAPADLAPDSVLGGTYRVVREIGRGGMGVVYEGYDQTLQRRVAIKRLQRDTLGSAEDVERFLREARLVAQLKHPNVAEIYTVVMEGEPFLVFEYIDGRSLDKVLSMNKSLPVPAVRRLVAQIGSALGAAHGRDIIHRDLKPSNVMIVGDGSAKVMDFGVAHQSRAATALTLTAAAGTPPYMAPEQGLGSVSKASDLYALGVMTYELLAGTRPFEGPDFLDAKLQRRYEAITLRTPALPAGLDAFFAQALEPDPTKRYSNTALFISEFDRACGA
jgi:tetratricopeptide (TPR) repeat protein/tRNA A-37 threonylcarbamoyl transferase component Bud32